MQYNIHRKYYYGDKSMSRFNNPYLPHINGWKRSGRILVMLCLLCCSSNVFADNTSPTIDTIKTSATNYIQRKPSYTLTPLTGTLPDGAVQVTINGTKYYYTPAAGSDIKTLQDLANIGNSALIETLDDNNSKLTYVVNGKYYTYDTDKLPGSGYTLTPAVTKGDTTITLYETAADGTLTPVYYNVELKKTEYGDSTGDTTLTFGWQKNADNKPEFKQNPATHIGQQITYKYNNRTSETPINDNRDHSGDTIEGLFINRTGAAKGGAIYQDRASAKLGDINADFISNYANSSSTAAGGAIYNHAGSIKDISGDFVGNHADSTNGDVWGGAILNWNGTVGNITGDFIGNYITSNNNAAKGGAIHNDNSKIGNITGDFIGNYASGKTAWGGVIYSKDKGSIKDITGNFIGNYAKAFNGTALGGAIYNIDKSTINNITGDFISNYIVSDNNIAKGGAIHNDKGNIGNITGDFVGNYASGGSTTYGGAVYNYNNKNNNTSTIGDITGDFIGNYAKSVNGVVFGGALLNWTEGSTSIATIGDITGDFIGNYIVSDNNIAKGGAIHNDKGNIGNIAGNFAGNYASGNSITYGGAIYNIEGATIKNITGNFSNNYAISTSNTAAGGAIYNNGTTQKKTPTIGNIDGNFIGNYAKSAGAVWGGAILNWVGEIGNINGDFKDNYLISSKNAAKGGAIHNDAAEIGDITGSFEGNYASGASSYGGAIYNKDNGNIADIEGNFINNHGTSSKGETLGGAIYNTNKSTIGNITGNFEDNYAFSATSTAQGGAIYDNNGKIGELDAGKLVGGIYGSFINNYAKTDSQNQLALGGAVYTKSDMNFIADGKDIEFTGNYTQDSRGKLNNAIFVETGSSSSPTIKLKAQNNGSITFNDQIDGGSVSGTTINRSNAYKLSLTGDETGLITLNDQIINANTVHDNVTLKIGNADTFKESTLATNSGIIDIKDGNYTNYNIKELKSSENTRYNIDISLSKDEQKADTFTIANGGEGVIYLSSINITNNCDYNDKFILQIIKSETDKAPELKYDASKVLQWATPNMTSDTIIAKDFGLVTTKTHNDSIAINGLLDAFPEWAELKTDESKSFTFVDGSEYIASRDITALNGSNLTINGHNNTLNINNKNIFSDIKDTQEITMNNMTVKNAEISNNGTINLDTITLDNSVNVNNNNTINISGNNTINSKITGTNGNINIKNGETTVNTLISNQSVSLNKSTLTLNNITGFNNNNLSLTDSNMLVQNLASNNIHLNNLNLSTNSNISIGNIDVDLKNKSMGRIYADTYGDTAGKINVQNLTLLNDAKTDKTDILFADAPLADSVRYSANKTIAYSPLYKYNISYNKNPEDNLGYFSFMRPGYSSGNPSDNFNPSVLATPVATQAGAYATQTQTFNYAFQHADTFMNIPYQERMAIRNSNKYALVDNTNAGTFSPLLANAKGAGYWVRPYATFESITLNNGPKVSSINYGTLIGFDSDIQTIKHGIDRVITGYVGYNGSSQRFSGVDSYQNGGLVGSTITLYKNNFFNATTLSVGASAGDNVTMYGRENFALLSAGIGNKTGYNFEFKEGRIILQPSFLVSYSFINTFDYTNAAGLRISSDPLNAIQLAPGIKLIGNTKNGWQPYASVNMVWNLLDKTKFTADNVRLPNMSIDPYIQYGLGVQKRCKDRFLAFGQAMIHNGGRNGLALTFGFRWALGNESHNNKERVQAPETTVKTSRNRTMIKHL